MMLGAVLRRMGCCDPTVHGFRSTFSEWAPRRRTTPTRCGAGPRPCDPLGGRGGLQTRGLFEKRKALMDDWTAYLGRKPTRAKVVHLDEARV